MTSNCKLTNFEKKIEKVYNKTHIKTIPIT